MNRKVAYGLMLVVATASLMPGVTAFDTGSAPADEGDAKIFCHPDPLTTVCAIVQAACDDAFGKIGRPCPFQ